MFVYSHSGAKTIVVPKLLQLKPGAHEPPSAAHELLLKLTTQLPFQNFNVDSMLRGVR